MPDDAWEARQSALPPPLLGLVVHQPAHAAAPRASLAGATRAGAIGRLWLAVRGSCLARCARCAVAAPRCAGAPTQKLSTFWPARGPPRPPPGLFPQRSALNSSR